MRALVAMRGCRSHLPRYFKRSSLRLLPPGDPRTRPSLFIPSGPAAPG